MDHPVKPGDDGFGGKVLGCLQPLDEKRDDALGRFLGRLAVFVDQVFGDDGMGLRLR
jgi:hypothetical protein